MTPTDHWHDPAVLRWPVLLRVRVHWNYLDVVLCFFNFEVSHIDSPIFAVRAIKRCAAIPAAGWKNVGTKKRVETVAKRKTADHGSSERRVLFTAVRQDPAPSEPCDDHGERCHQDRAKACEPAWQCAETGSLPSLICFLLAKLTTRMLFAVATPMHMMVPISAGTLRVVCVMKNRNHADSGQRRRSAEIMMKGSSQDFGNLRRSAGSRQNRK